MWLRCMMCSCLVALAAACEHKAPLPPPAPAPAPVIAMAEVGEAHQPKPGERVRQPLLDEHCSELAAPVAFYYHGGRPFAQRALSDGCRPLYITECEDNGECAQSSEQEQGMWCCSDTTTQTAHAERQK